MPLLTEIHRSEGVNVNGKTILREAVRAVILDEIPILNGSPFGRMFFSRIKQIPTMAFPL